MTERLSQSLAMADLIWLRETEAQDLATPERRAGLERRLREIAQEISDETLRRYYRDDFKERLYKLFGQRRESQPQRRERRGPQAAFGQRRGFEWVREDAARAPPVASATLSKSPLFQAGTSSLLPREALILLLSTQSPRAGGASSRSDRGDRILECGSGGSARRSARSRELRTCRWRRNPPRRRGRGLCDDCAKARRPSRTFDAFLPKKQFS